MNIVQAMKLLNSLTLEFREKYMTSVSVENGEDGLVLRVRTANISPNEDPLLFFDAPIGCLIEIGDFDINGLPLVPEMGAIMISGKPNKSVLGWVEKAGPLKDVIEGVAQYLEDLQAMIEAGMIDTTAKSGKSTL